MPVGDQLLTMAAPMNLVPPSTITRIRAPPAPAAVARQPTGAAAPVTAATTQT
jgi:hypothetical protein